MPALLAKLRSTLRALADRVLPEHLRHARLGEELAFDYLRREGYTIVARNFRARGGREEIDLIGWDADQLAIIEVKTRASDEFGAPELAVDRDKQRRLIRAAEEYARRSRIHPARLRFDIVSVLLGNEPSLRLLKDAFARRSEPVPPWARPPR